MVKFGPSGMGEDYENIETINVPKMLKEMGLDCYEYSFGHGYRMSDGTAVRYGKEFKDQGITLSFHAPYYINFANPEEEMYQKSIGYLERGIELLKASGADHLVFHPGSCGKAARSDAYQLIFDRFKELMPRLDSKLSKGMWLCPETMGKSMQIGTFKEVVDLCTLSPYLVPTFDFGHINALTQGTLKTKEDFKQIFQYGLEKLGREKMNNLHIHFSKIQYGDKGEIRHLNFEDNIYGPNFEPMIDAIIELDISPRIICESAGKQPRDAKIMKNYYESTRQNI